MWDVLTTDEFDKWFKALTNKEQEEMLVVINLLIAKGPKLGRPYADTINGSTIANLKELREKYSNQQYRMFYAFDPQ